MVEINSIYKIAETLKEYNSVNERVLKPFGFKTDYQLMLFEATSNNLDSFNIFLSSDWINKTENTHILLKNIYSFFRNNLSNEINRSVNAIFFVHTSDQTVQYFNYLYNFNNQAITFIPSMQIGNNLIENAYLVNPKKTEKVLT